jgi:hypothetical protein
MRSDGFETYLNVRTLYVFEWNMLSVKCSYSASQCINNKKNKQYSELINCINTVNTLFSFNALQNIINKCNLLTLKVVVKLTILFYLSLLFIS